MTQLPFDWSELTRSNLYSMFYSLNSEIVGKELSPSQIQKRIIRHVKAHIPLKLKKCIYAPTTPGFVFMGGVYYSDLDRKKLPAIEVNFNYNPADKKLKLTQHRFKRILHSLRPVLLQRRPRKLRLLKKAEFQPLKLPKAIALLLSCVKRPKEMMLLEHRPWRLASPVTPMTTM
jgi:hypothetical protein